MTTQRNAARSVRPQRALAVAGATAAVAPLWIGAWAMGVEFDVVSGGRPMVVSLPLVLTTALAVSLAGWGALALLERLTARAARIWTAIAVAVLLISLVPLPAVETGSATRVVLALMHVAVGAVLIPALRATTTARDATTVATATAGASKRA